GGMPGLLGNVAWPDAGVCAAAIVATASTAAPAILRITPLILCRMAFYTAIGRAPCPSGSGSGTKKLMKKLVWPRYHRINQLAAFAQFVERRAQFAHVLAPQPARHRRRGLTGDGFLHLRS